MILRQELSKLVARIRSIMCLMVSPLQTDIESKKMRGKAVPGKAIVLLCIASFLAGTLFTSQTWSRHNSEVKDQVSLIPNYIKTKKPEMTTTTTKNLDHNKRVSFFQH